LIFGTTSCVNQKLVHIWFAIPTPMKFHHLLLTAIFFCFSHYSYAQDSLSFNKSISDNYLETVAGKAGKVEEKLDRQSQKALERFQKQEARLYKKLSRIDSSKATALFNKATDQYKSLEQRLEKGLLSKSYNASLDTVFSSLKFLKQNSEWLSKSKDVREKLQKAIGKVGGLQSKFQKADADIVNDIK
jgi:hypothetical protein